MYCSTDEPQLRGGEVHDTGELQGMKRATNKTEALDICTCSKKTQFRSYDIRVTEVKLTDLEVIKDLSQSFRRYSNTDTRLAMSMSA